MLRSSAVPSGLLHGVWLIKPKAEALDYCHTSLRETCLRETSFRETSLREKQLRRYDVSILLALGMPIGALPIAFP
jgi:hypothetical protein